MSSQHELIFRKAMVSKNLPAILEVARAFEAIGDNSKGTTLRKRVGSMFAFGATARGTPIQGTGSAVIPPGRYWLDITSTAKYSFALRQSKWLNFTMDHPEVTVEKAEYSGTADKLVYTVIFTIPPDASNYGLPGVLFPTDILGFPTIANQTVQSVKDTVQRPPPMTSLEALAETPNLLGQGLQQGIQQGVQYTAETIGKAAKGVGEGLGISRNTFIMMGIGAIVSLVLLNRLMMPKLPI